MNKSKVRKFLIKSSLFQIKIYGVIFQHYELISLIVTDSPVILISNYPYRVLMYTIIHNEQD